MRRLRGGYRRGGCAAAGRPRRLGAGGFRLCRPGSFPVNGLQAAGKSYAHHPHGMERGSIPVWSTAASKRSAFFPARTKQKGTGVHESCLSSLERKLWAFALADRLGAHGEHHFRKFATCLYRASGAEWTSRNQHSRSPRATLAAWLKISHGALQRPNDRASLLSLGATDPLR
jgi:hypothetical protein